SLRENLYAADIGLAFQAWESDRPQRARELLEQWRPNGQTDLRGFEWRYLQGLTRPTEKYVFTSSSRQSVSSALSPDNRFVPMGAYDGRVDLWDFDTHQLLRPGVAPQGIIYTLAFSPGSQTLASTMASAITEANGFISLWGLQSFTLKKKLP